VDGDPVRLVQVVTNLLNNAAKFTEPGGQLALTLEQRDDQAVITVKDNGRGIDPVCLDQVFELFTQADGTEHQSNGGLGVGLYLSKQLIQMHDGTIKANSHGPHRGSEFVIQLPLVRVSKKVSNESPAAPQETPRCIRRILVVDDNLDAASVLQLLLQQKGHEVRMAHDGHAALECVQVFNPEIVLLDIGMSDMDGYEVCRQIRATARGRRIVVCAVTGWGQPEDKKKAYEAGFDCHLTKPVKIDDILSQVNGYRGGDMKASTQVKESLQSSFCLHMRTSLRCHPHTGGGGGDFLRW
jgi:CheY-like chemotaxis protein